VEGSGGKLQAVRSLGVRHVIDYAQEGFTKTGQRYDLVIDDAVYRSTIDYKRDLSPKSAYGVTEGSFFQAVFHERLISLLGIENGCGGRRPKRRPGFLGGIDRCRHRRNRD
jgi:hypothetical protein